MQNKSMKRKNDATTRKRSNGKDTTESNTHTSMGTHRHQFVSHKGKLTSNSVCTFQGWFGLYIALRGSKKVRRKHAIDELPTISTERGKERTTAARVQQSKHTKTEDPEQLARGVAKHGTHTTCAVGQPRPFTEGGKACKPNHTCP
jgi:hypothetical protein